MFGSIGWWVWAIAVIGGPIYLWEISSDESRYILFYIFYAVAMFTIIRAGRTEHKLQEELAKYKPKEEAEE